MGGGVESSQDNLNPREAEGTRGDETLGALTASCYQQGKDGRGRGGGDKNPPTARATREQGTDGDDGVARRDMTDALDEAMETAAGAGGAGYLPKHFEGPDGAMTKNGKQSCCEYDKVASEASEASEALEASERGQASAGPATGEDGHGATTHRAGRTREEEG